MADKVRKCRQARHEKNGRSKLSDDLVAQIREKLKDGATKRGLAREYGVSDTLIRYIAKGKIWV
jgi:DNA-binding GntR family transcriptional regulator